LATGEPIVFSTAREEDEGEPGWEATEVNAEFLAQQNDIIVHASEMDWRPFGPGTWLKPTFVSRETGMWAGIFKLEAGSQFAPHFHKGAIDFYVIKGELKYRGVVAREGDYAYEPMGVFHPGTISDVETIVMAHFFGSLEFVDDDNNVVLILDWKYVLDNFSDPDGAPAPISFSREKAAL
jgi:quercetin dioxygenase-like cupin family protein